MSKLRSFFEITSYGIYKHWDEKDKALPKIKTFTTDIPAELDIEFGFIINCKKAKGKKLRYCIFHPDIPDDKGDIMPPFEGDVYVENNDWDFYLGDTIWPPLENKLGDWRMTIELDEKVLAEKTFSVLVEHGDGEIQFWKKRGY
ncbi:DUF3859 domain-containing protein [Paraglaciecola chathamensis]|uniref:DUF3859 domain-containing protein n=1 Tax=Paraglaciecola chathamensis TaxID=368405 RepID=A0A8H9IDC9_9ALTE|nr:DUF3859 domain-containing protein [Paraglaciecola oceanifecundans]GGZ75045.1 hypothetical protein GCM10011274_36550 [Paraglaciecola oceanifecundans]